MRHLPVGVETALDSIDNVFPGPGIFRGLAMGQKPFVQEGLLPLLKWHMVHASRDPIPQRLYVLDLFVDGQCVKSWRRQRQRMWHVPDYTTSPGVI